MCTMNGMLMLFLCGLAITSSAERYTRKVSYHDDVLVKWYGAAWPHKLGVARR